MENLVSTLLNYIESGNMPILALIAAFLGGVVASLSPCSLGILPLIIGYVAGYSHERNLKLFVQLTSFSLGSATILTIIGVVSALTGKIFAGIASPIWILLLASLIMISGLNLIGLVDVNFPMLIKKFPKGNSNSFFMYPFGIGVIFGLASSPCASPILASILAIASISANIGFAILLLFSFALGECLIVIISGLSASAIKNLKNVSNFTVVIMKMGGVIFVLMALYIYYRILLPLFLN